MTQVTISHFCKSEGIIEPNAEKFIDSLKIFDIEDVLNVPNIKKIAIKAKYPEINEISDEIVGSVIFILKPLVEELLTIKSCDDYYKKVDEFYEFIDQKYGKNHIDNFLDNLQGFIDNYEYMGTNKDKLKFGEIIIEGYLMFFRISFIWR